jgi:hypothetical protein
LKLHAKNVSIGEAGDEYFQVSFDSEVPSDDDFDLSGPDHPYLIVQRQFEDDDGGVCYIETHDRDTYAGDFRLKLIEFTPTRLAFEMPEPTTNTSRRPTNWTRNGSVKCSASCTSFLACKAETAAGASGGPGVILGKAILIEASVLAIGLRTRWRPVSRQVPPSPRTSRGDGF